VFSREKLLVPPHLLIWSAHVADLGKCKERYYASNMYKNRPYVEHDDVLGDATISYLELMFGGDSTF
jgi:hypothetical protein